MTRVQSCVHKCLTPADITTIYTRIVDYSDKTISIYIARCIYVQIPVYIHIVCIAGVKLLINRHAISQPVYVNDALLM